MNIRPGTEADLDSIAAIQGESDEAAHWRPAEYLAYSIRIAVESGRAVGFVVTRDLAAGESEILNLAVRQDCRRSGVGAALVREALSASPGVYYLEVRESNTVARNFYKSMGFGETGRRRKYYNDPDEDAIVMRIRS